MKRKVFYLLCLVLSLLFVYSIGATETLSDDGLWVYEAYGDGVALTAYNGSATDVYVPSNIEVGGETFDVLKLGDSIFENNDALNSVSLGAGILEIGDRAFYDADNMVCILLAEDTTTIGAEAFYSCDKLNSIILYDAVTTIGENAFSECPELTVWCNEDTAGYTYATDNAIKYEILNPAAEPEIFTLDGITYYIMNGEAYAVEYDNSSRYPVIPSTVNGYPVTELRGTFMSGTISGVDLPNTLKSIGEFAFYKCSSFAELEIPESVTKIENRAFSYCTIDSLVIYDNLDSVGEWCFMYWDNVPNIYYSGSPKDWKAITVAGYNEYLTSANVYYNCIGEASMTVGEIICFTDRFISVSEFIWSAKDTTVATVNNGVVTAIGAGITSLNITTADGSIIASCEVTVVDAVEGTCGENATWTYSNEKLVISGAGDMADYTSTTIPWREYIASITEVVIEDGVTSIGRAAFVNCSALATITISDTVTIINPSAFYGCKSIKEIEIPKGVTHIGAAAFRECEQLTSLVVPEGVETIGSGCFQNCYALESITLPASLTTIGERAFFECTSFKTVYYGGTTNQWSKVNVMRGSSWLHNATFYFNCVDESFVYTNDSINFTSIFISSENSNVTWTSSDTSVATVSGGRVSPRSVGTTVITVTVNDGSYTSSSTLSVLPTEGTCGENAYWSFSNGKLTISGSGDMTNFAGVTSTPWYYFKNDILKVYIGDGITSIGGFSFAMCPSINYVSIPDSVTQIGFAAFLNAQSLEYIDIPDSVTSIGSFAFWWCDALKEIIIPEGVKNINQYAFFACLSLTKAELPSTLTMIDNYAFEGCEILYDISIPENVTSIGKRAFTKCYKITNLSIPTGVSEIKTLTFGYCDSLKTLYVPATITSIEDATAFYDGTILLVEENSYAHTFAEENDLLYFVLHKTENPEINYGASISGTVNYTDGSAATGATVEILYDDGTVKETVTTDETGEYAFTYAEVGQYTIRATDANGNTSATTVSVKRMNVFDVYVSGDTNLTLKQGWTVSGTTSETTATVTITDENGNVIDTVETTDGTYSFDNIPNGTYIVIATTENGSISTEITVYNNNVTGITLTIPTATEVATIWGYAEVEDRDKNHHRRNWVEITIYNADGIAVGHAKSDGDGKYTFANLPLGEYTIVAETAEMRPDKDHGFDRSFKLVGYAYVNAEEAITYQAETITLYEENDSLATISGKVAAQGETQSCEVILRNVFRHEVAKQTTSNNGKYSFVNVRDGLYFIFAVTESDGMGMAIVVVRDGKVYGDTDITVYKHQHIKDRDDKFREEINCSSRDEALVHRERIAEEKRFYDGLSEKEKKQLSRDYIERLERYSAWLAEVDYTAPDGVTVEQGGLVVSGDELEKEETISFNLTVEKQEEYVPSTDGVKNDKDYKHHNMKDNAGHREIKEYYEIKMTKTTADGEKEITSVTKDTDSNGKFRITMEIPEEYRGYKNYTMLHEHHGEVVTLVDLDDDPNTITFEVDKFSTFALAVSDEATFEVVPETGDVDGSGVIDILDVMMTIKGVLNNNTSDLHDMNEDGVLNLIDVLRILKIAVA